MNVVGSRRRWSIGWWGVILGAFLLVGCYLVFDVLDLDRSDLQRRLFSTTIAAQDATAEVKRGLPQPLAAPGTYHASGVWIHLVPVCRSLVAPPHPLLAVSSHVRRIRPRAHAGYESLEPSSPDDVPWPLARVA